MGDQFPQNRTDQLSMRQWELRMENTADLGHFTSHMCSTEHASHELQVSKLGGFGKQPSTGLQAIRIIIAACVDTAIQKNTARCTTAMGTVYGTEKSIMSPQYCSDWKTKTVGRYNCQCGNRFNCNGNKLKPCYACQRQWVNNSFSVWCCAFVTMTI